MLCELFFCGKLAAPRQAAGHDLLPQIVKDLIGYPATLAGLSIRGLRRGHSLPTLLI
jgi:hypothetical protein